GRHHVLVADHALRRELARDPLEVPVEEPKLSLAAVRAAAQRAAEHRIEPLGGVGAPVADRELDAVPGAEDRDRVANRREAAVVLDEAREHPGEDRGVLHAEQEALGERLLDAQQASLDPPAAQRTAAGPAPAQPAHELAQGASAAATGADRVVRDLAP